MGMLMHRSLLRQRVNAQNDEIRVEKVEVVENTTSTEKPVKKVVKKPTTAKTTKRKTSK